MEQKYFENNPGLLRDSCPVWTPHTWHVWNCSCAVSRWCCISSVDILSGAVGLAGRWIKSRHPRESVAGDEGAIPSLFLSALLPVCTRSPWRSRGVACVVIVGNHSIVGCLTRGKPTVVKPAVPVALPAGVLYSLSSLQDSVMEWPRIVLLLNCAVAVLARNPCAPLAPLKDPPLLCFRCPPSPTSSHTWASS